MGRIPGRHRFPGDRVSRTGRAFARPATPLGPGRRCADRFWFSAGVPSPRDGGSTRVSRLRIVGSALGLYTN